MNKVTLLKDKLASDVSLGQIYSRVSATGELAHWIVCQSDSGYYLFNLASGFRWASCAKEINEVFGADDEFILVTEPIVLTPTSD